MYCIPYIEKFLSIDGYSVKNRVKLLKSEKKFVNNWEEGIMIENDTEWIVNGFDHSFDSLKDFAQANNYKFGVTMTKKIEYPDFLMGEKLHEFYYFTQDKTPAFWAEYEEGNVIYSSGKIYATTPLGFETESQEVGS